jgi:ArsR family transcriptional regulator
MHDLPAADESFDTVFLMHALTYTTRPQTVLTEASRVLKPAGTLLAVTLEQHRHQKAVELYNHINLGFTKVQLEKLARAAGLAVQSCTVATVEKRTPNFAILTLSATKA